MLESLFFGKYGIPNMCKDNENVVQELYLTGNEWRAAISYYKIKRSVSMCCITSAIPESDTLVYDNMCFTTTKKCHYVAEDN